LPFGGYIALHGTAGLDVAGPHTAKWAVTFSRFKSRLYLGAILLVATACGTVTIDRTVPVVQPTGALRQLADGFAFTEGPAADAAGNVYFTDIPRSNIHRWDAASDRISLHRANSGEANGLIFDLQGRLVACEMLTHRVTRDDLHGAITVLADRYAGQPLHMPNDLWIDAQGGVYFSDFLGPDASIPGGLQVYYIAPDTHEVIRATGDLLAPNGVIGSADGRFLYVTDPGHSATYRYPIVAAGRLGKREDFVAEATDGMAIDERGNVYFSGDEIRVFSPAGELVTRLPLPQRSANLTFAGPDRRTLFITAMNAIYVLPMNVRGAPTPLEMANMKHKAQAR
jgi:gluconolactonase